MAERDGGRPAPGALSTEEADRLSERFRPSWEADADPPTVPRVAPAPPGRSVPRPTPPAPPAAGGSPAAGGDAKRSPTPTLIGIQRTIAIGPSAAPDDLDWEAPSQAVAADAHPSRPAAPAGSAASAEPEATSIEVEELPPDSSEPLSVEVEELPPDSSEPLPVEVEELPPPSKPSGIGQTYVPKDQNAPAIVLNDEVRAAEAEAQAKLEAQHRSRRAQTIVRMRVEDLGLPPEPPEPPPFVTRRRTGLWIGLASVLLLTAALGIFLFAKKPASREREVSAGVATAEATAPARPATAVAAATTAAAAAPAEPVATSKAEPVAVIPQGEAATPSEDEDGASGPDAPEPAKTAARKQTKPAGAPKPVQPSKPGSGSKPSKGVIVRDSPF